MKYRLAFVSDYRIDETELTVIKLTFRATIPIPLLADVWCQLILWSTFLEYNRNKPQTVDRFRSLGPVRGCGAATRILRLVMAVGVSEKSTCANGNCL